jgi:TonB family protein
MNRTQKKCFMASAGLHLLLLLILLIGPALSFSGKGPTVTPIDFIPSKIIEGAMAGGGNPNANPPPPTQQPPAPEQTPRVEQPRELPHPNLEPSSKPPKHEIQVNTKLVARRSTDKTTNARPSSDSKDVQAKREADALGKAVAGLRNNLAPTTTFELRGPGGGGETYAGVEQAILSVYNHAWISPEGIDTTEASVEVSVTIESNGSVSSARIIHASGDARMDQSVQRALDRVSSIPGWDGKRRTVEFSIISRAKETT